jgi:hypothetical protein
VIGSNLFPLDAGGVWADVGPTPVIVVTQEPVIMEAPAAPARAVVKTPSAEQQGAIVLVRGGSKTYVTFTAAKSG